MLFKLCHKLNGAIVLGLLVLAWAERPVPPIVHVSIKIPDVLEDVLWQGCKTEAIKRIQSKF